MYFWKYILAKKAGLSQQKCNMALYGLPVLPIAEAFEKIVTGNPISVTDALAQDALSLQVSFTPTQDGTPSIDSEPTTSPYLSKVIPRGNKEYYSLVGATVAWNQIARKVHTAGLVNGLTRSDASHDDVKAVRVFGECTVGTNYTVFYSDRTIENRVCMITLGNVELPTGSRLSLSEKDKTTTVIYKAPSTMTSFTLYVANGVSIDVTLYPQVFDLTSHFGSSTIADYIYSLEQATEGAGVQWLKDNGFLTKDYYPCNPGELISVNTSGKKIGSTTYPIDNIDLRGLFKLNNGKLYCEGDTYKSNGTVTRNFEYRAYQSGDESLADAITDGTHTVVKLATPTTESATPYTSPIDVEAGGTEELIDNRSVPIPVGNETYYASEYEVHGKTGVTVSHGATADDPNPTEHEVEFTSQGTVYGGTVDIVTGVLTVTWAILSNPQNLNWISNSSQGMKSFQTDRGTVSKKSGSNNWKCSRYSNGFIGTDKAEGIFIFDSGEVCIRDYRYWEHGGTSEEVAAFKASLADVTIAYELAEPQTYQLTPQQVQMLLNDNYLETKDGTITLTYMVGK